VDFVNSFSLIFLEFLMKFYQAIFFSWAENAKQKGDTENRTEPAREPRQAGRPGPTGPGGRSGGLPPIYSEMQLFDFLLWLENSKGSLKKENAVSSKMRFLDYSFSDYLTDRDGSSGIHGISHSLAPT
jgi:hypothetical protein